MSRCEWCGHPQNVDGRGRCCECGAPSRPGVSKALIDAMVRSHGSQISDFPADGSMYETMLEAQRKALDAPARSHLIGAALASAVMAGYWATKGVL